MRAGLIHRRGEEDDQFDGVAVDRAELQRLGRAADGHLEARHLFGLAVGHRDAAADAGRPHRLTLPDRFLELVRLGDVRLLTQQIRQLEDGILLVVGLEGHDQAVGLEDIGEQHKQAKAEVDGSGREQRRRGWIKLPVSGGPGN